jgi:hypothetical protein
MKAFCVRRVVVVAVCASALVVAAALLCAPAYFSSHPHPDAWEYAKVMAAAQQYRADLEAREQRVPDSVTLRELVERGLLRQDDARHFEGLQVSVSLRTAPDRLREDLMRVRFPNGDECVAMGDGSVQQFPSRNRTTSPSP